MAEPTDLELWLSRSATPGPVDLDLGASLNDVLVRGTLTAQLQASLASVAADIVIPGSLAAQDNPSGRISGTVVIEGGMVGHAPQLVASARGDMVITAEVTAETREAAMLAGGSYDINVYRDPAGYGGSRWLRTAASQAPESAQIIWDAGLRTNPVKISGWQAPAGIDRQSVGQFSNLPSSDSARVERTAEAAELITGGWWPWVSLPSSHRARTELHAEAPPVGSGSVLPFFPRLPRRYRQRQESWRVPAIVSMSLLRQRIVKGRWLEIDNHSLFEQAIRPGPGRHDIPVPPLPPLATPVNLDLHVLRWLMPDLDFDPGRAAIIIPTRRYYIVINSAQLIRARDGLDIPAASVSLEVDRDSTSWQFSATVPSVRLAELMEGEEAIIEVNGHSWRCVVDGWSDNRSFNQSSATITGRSLSAKLSSSLALTRSHAAASPAMLQQLAQAELGEQWVLQWDAADWLIPGGIWSYQNQAPLDAIKTLAEAAGGFVLPDMASHKLRVLPRYKNSPWDITEADIQIPEAIMLAMGRQRNKRVAPNGVWVTGGNAGITAFIRRDGTAGNILVDDVTNPLITHAIGARALGSRVIISAMPSSVDSLELPLSDDTGLILPGQTIALPSGYGYSHGVKITAGRDSDYKLKVRQAIEVERVLLEA